ncbi:TetR family transcriptional regulator C-terminal domain-containing protein [Gordonia sp. CPCC 206044]|uniref:TetR/AcrR family transcriptional regulator n=1 Tax=Gordonia sp. CPCC 206044 TaxID=3140793 RepID=UPI003AF36A28
MSRRIHPDPLTSDELGLAVLAVAADHGLAAATIREVAARVGVSIGAVQHHFPTKASLQIHAFVALVDRVSARVDRAVRDSAHPIEDALAELVPLDEERRAEARVMIEFAALAVRTPALAEVQERTLRRIRDGLANALERRGVSQPGLRAAALIAVVDGLALHMASTGGGYPDEDLGAVLHDQLSLVLGERAAG